MEAKRHGLSNGVDDARAADAKEYLDSVNQYQHEFEEWKEKRDIAERVLAEDLTAYKEVFEEIAPFSEISDLGSSVQFRFDNPTLIEITLTIRARTQSRARQRVFFKAASYLRRRCRRVSFTNSTRITFVDACCVSQMKRLHYCHLKP